MRGKIAICSIIYIVNFLHDVNAQNLNADCAAARTGAAGICRLINECPIVLQELTQQKLEPNYCGLMGNRRLVCCPIPRAAPTTTTARPLREDDSISVKKCYEYQKVVYETVLLGDGISEQFFERKVFRCPLSIVPLIVGGEEAAPKEFPHMAIIGFRDGKKIVWGCGGALISDEYILTAAHCLHDNELGYAKYVRLGELDLDNDKEDASPVDFNISERIKHPDYNLPAKYNDIALIKLDRPVTFNQFIRPACLPLEFSPKTVIGVASGFGSLRARGPSSNRLMKVALELFKHDECNITYGIDAVKLPMGIDDKTQMCAGSHTERRDTCQGDSGGPFQTIHALHCMYSIDGVTSFGKSCGRINTPGVYTRVYQYIKWIESIVWPNSVSQS